MIRFERKLLPLALALACAATLPAQAQDHAAHAAQAQEHAAHAAQAQEHAAHAAHAQAAVPAPGVRYATDAPLRKGMAEIRTAVGMLEHHEHGHLDEAQVRKLAGNIERSIGGIIAECKLDPKADAVLHGIIGRLGQGIAALKQHPADTAPVKGMRAALEDYARLFDDPGAVPMAPTAAPATSPPR